MWMEFWFYLHILACVSDVNICCSKDPVHVCIGHRKCAIENEIKCERLVLRWKWQIGREKKKVHKTIE